MSNIVQNLIAKHNAFIQSLMEEQKKVPAREVETVQSRIEEFGKLKEELLSSVETIGELVDKVRTKLHSVALTEQNVDGLLHESLESYLECFQVRREQLDQLLQLEDQHWKKTFKRASEGYSKIQKQLQHALAKSQQEIESIILQDPIAQYRPFSLKKLSMWGQRVTEEDLTFAWPKQEFLDHITFDVKLQSLEFQACPISRIQSVRCTLTNGQQSPVFERSSFAHYHRQTIQVNLQKPVRAISARDNRKTSDWVFSLHFFDEDGQELTRYCPHYNTGPMEDHHMIDVAPNEELIGVYGVIKSEREWFTSFGFIVKAYHNN